MGRVGSENGQMSLGMARGLGTLDLAVDGTVSRLHDEICLVMLRCEYRPPVIYQPLRAPVCVPQMYIAPFQMVP